MRRRSELAANIALGIFVVSCVGHGPGGDPTDRREENKEVVRRFLEEVVSTGEVDRIEELVAPEYAERYEGELHHLGTEGAREHVLGVRRTYPDLEITVERQVAEGDWVATSITARGTHLGEWLGMRPTGKRMEYTGVNLDRVVDGRIVEHGGAANMMQPLLEAGALRVVGEEGGPDPVRSEP